MPTILIIDDDKEIRDMARAVLSHHGYAVLDEDNTNAGIATARRQLPDLILMDISMPYLDGWTATRLIKSDPALARVPVIAWTALGMKGGEAGALAAGYDGYLPKPIDLNCFVDQITAFLRAREPESPPAVARKPAALPFIPLAYLTEARLLVVAGDEATRREFCQWLLGMGYRHVLSAADIATVLNVAHVHHLDLVLLDMDVNGASGLEALRQFRARPYLQTVPVIMVMSSCANHADTARALEVGADDYVQRPIDWDELAVRVSDRLRIKLLEDRLRRQQSDLEVLYRASQVLNASLDPSMVMTMILEQAAVTVGAAGGGLYLLDTERRSLQQLYTGSVTELPREKLEAILERGAAGWAMEHLEVVLINDTSRDPRWLKTEGKEIHSSLIAPLVGREGVLGVLVLDHPEPDYFTHEHATLLSALAAQAAVALDNARLFEQVGGERKKLSAILDNSVDAVVVVDDEMRVRLVNGAARQVLSLPPGVTGRLIREMLADSPLLKLLDDAQRDGPTSMEVEIGGGIYSANVRAVPGVGQVVLLQDIHLLKEIEQLKLERERQETEHVRREFARHMSPRVVELLLKRSETLSLPHKTKAAVLFSDLRNFTSLTERIGVEAMMEYVLKRYIAVMTDMIYAHEGTINKLLGDGIMAVFGVPIPQPDAPQRALRTAMVMLRALSALRAGWLRDLNQDVSMGVGLAWGEVIAGDIGSSQFMDYTVIGDPVNTAARLGEIALPGEVLISQPLAEVAGDEPEWRLEPLPPMWIRGKDLPQQVYRAVPTWSIA
jgi:DNA-binding response OmpR family regulator/class 3 adenylate cyclase